MSGLNSPSPHRRKSPESYESAAKEIELEKQVVAALKRLSFGHLLNNDADAVFPDLEYLDRFGRAPSLKNSDTTDTSVFTDKSADAATDMSSDKAADTSFDNARSPEPTFVTNTNTNELLDKGTETVSPMDNAHLSPNLSSPHTDGPETPPSPDAPIDLSDIWVPANAHPEINPQVFQSHVHNTLGQLLERKLSRSKSGRRSSLSQELSVPSDARPRDLKRLSNPLLQVLSSELEELLRLAGMDANDAVTLARSLSTSSLGYTDAEKQAFGELGSPPGLAEILDLGDAHRQGDFSLKRSRRLDYRKSPAPGSPLQNRKASAALGSQLQSRKAENLAELRNTLVPSQSTQRSSLQSINPRSSQLLFSYKPRDSARVTSHGGGKSVSAKSKSTESFHGQNPQSPILNHAASPQSHTNTPTHGQSTQHSYRTFSHGGRSPSHELLQSHHSPRPNLSHSGHHARNHAHSTQPQQQQQLQVQHQQKHIQQQKHQHAGTSNSRSSRRNLHLPSQHSGPGYPYPYPSGHSHPGHHAQSVQPRSTTNSGPIAQPGPVSQPGPVPHPGSAPQAGSVAPSSQSGFGPHSPGYSPNTISAGSFTSSYPSASGFASSSGYPTHSGHLTNSYGYPNQAVPRQTRSSRHKTPAHTHVKDKRDKTRELNQNLDLLRNEINEFKESLSKAEPEPVPLKTEEPREVSEPQADFSFDLSSHDVSYEDSLGIERDILHELDVERSGPQFDMKLTTLFHTASEDFSNHNADEKLLPKFENQDAMKFASLKESKSQSPDVGTEVKQKNDPPRRKYSKTSPAEQLSRDRRAQEPIPNISQYPQNETKPLAVSEEKAQQRQEIDKELSDRTATQQNAVVQESFEKTASTKPKGKTSTEQLSQKPIPSFEPTSELEALSINSDNTKANIRAKEYSPSTEMLSRELTASNTKPSLQSLKEVGAPVAEKKQEESKIRKKKSFGSLTKHDSSEKHEKKKKGWLWSKERSVSTTSAQSPEVALKLPSRAISSPEISLSKKGKNDHGKENVISKLFKKKRSNSFSSEKVHQSAPLREIKESGPLTDKDTTPTGASLPRKVSDKSRKNNDAKLSSESKTALVIEEKEPNGSRNIADKSGDVKSTDEKVKALFRSTFKKKQHQDAKDELVHTEETVEDKSPKTEDLGTKANVKEEEEDDEEFKPQTTQEVQEKLKKVIRRTSRPNQPIQFTDSAFGFPLPPPSQSTLVMIDHRFPVHVERAIYRLSHLKLANPKRSLREQVLLSNFMYAYLNLVDHTLHLEQQMSLEEQALDQPEADMGKLTAEDPDTEFEMDDDLDEGAFDTIKLDLDVQENQISV